MNKKLMLISISSLFLLVGCASYKADPLGTFSLLSTKSTSRVEPDVLVVAKRFDEHDCKRHLDRDVIEEGYQPVQLFIKNNTNQSLYFSIDKLSLVCASPSAVADKVHTATAVRVLNYTAGSLLFAPLVIPAVVDGVMSFNANRALDADFESKSAYDQVIAPGAYFNKLLFVPKAEYRSMFDLSLLEIETGEYREIQVPVI